MKHHPEQQGFIMTIILILVALVLLQNVFHIDVVGFISKAISSLK